MSTPISHMSTHKLISYCQRGLAIGMGYGGFAYGTGYVYGLLSPRASPSLLAAIFGIGQAAYRTLNYASLIWQREKVLERNPEWRKLKREELKNKLLKKCGRSTRMFSGSLVAAHYVLTSLAMKQFELINTRTEMRLIGIIAFGHTLFTFRPRLIEHLKKLSLHLTTLAYLITFVAMKHFELMNNRCEVFLFTTIAVGHLSLFIYPRIILYL